MVPFGQQLILIASLLLVGCSANSDEEAQNLVTHFYQTHQANRPGGALSLNDLITFRPFLSIPLFDMLKDVSVAEEAHQAQADNLDPPLVDGDLFTTNPQGSTDFRLLTCQIDQDSSNCSVEVIYRDVKLTTPFKSIDRIVLSRDARGWVIDNIVYGGSKLEGMHQGDLQKNLQGILKSSTHSNGQ